jgi:hypothetical protein
MATDRVLSEQEGWPGLAFLSLLFREVAGEPPAASTAGAYTSVGRVQEPMHA